MGLTGCLHNSETDELDTNESEDDDGEDEQRELTEEEIRESLRNAPEPGSRDAMTTFQYDLANTGYNTNATGPTEDVEPSWTFEAEGTLFTSPLTEDLRVYFSSNSGNVYCLDAESGDVRWRDETSRQINSPASIAGALLFQPVRGPEGLIAYDKRTGEMIWSYDDLVPWTSVSVEDTVYVCVRSSSGVSRRHQVNALDAASGDERWSQTVPNLNPTHPAYSDGELVVTADDSVVALDGDDGTEVRRWRRGDSMSIYSTPTLDGDTVYVGGYLEHLTAVNLEAEEELWSFREGLSDETPFSGEATRYRSVNTSAAVDDERVYFATKEDGFYAVSKSGEEIWRREIDSSIATVHGPLVVEGSVYLVADGALYALDRATGETRWQLDEGFRSSPAVADGTVYAGTEDGTLYALSET